VTTLARQVRQFIGQYASIDETLTGAENLILIGRLVVGQPQKEAKQRAAALVRVLLPGSSERVGCGRR
jgi:oleandomycin transport system ATP-binding protein